MIEFVIYRAVSPATTRGESGMPRPGRQTGPILRRSRTVMKRGWWAAVASPDVSNNAARTQSSHRSPFQCFAFPVATRPFLGPHWVAQQKTCLELRFFCCSLVPHGCSPCCPCQRSRILGIEMTTCVGNSRDLRNSALTQGLVLHPFLGLSLSLAVSWDGENAT